MDKINLKQVSQNLEEHNKFLNRFEISVFNDGSYHSGILILIYNRGRLRFKKFNLQVIANLLVENGFGVIGSIHSGALSLVRVQNDIIEKVTEVSIHRFIQQYIGGYPVKKRIKYEAEDTSGEVCLIGDIYRAELEQAYNESSGKLFPKGYWIKNLPPLEKPLLKDSKNTSYMAFRNIVVRVKPIGYNLLNYGQLDGLIWKDHIIDDDFKKDDHKGATSEYKKFIANICDGIVKKYNCFVTSMGFLLHNYSTPSNRKIVVCTDENSNSGSMAEGGTGKGIFVNGIKQCRNTERVDAKSYNPNDSFLFQDVKVTTQIVWLDDPYPNFPIERLNSLITEGIIGRKLYQSNFHISPEYGPKMIIASNYLLKGRGSTFKRRQINLRFGNHYSQKIKNGIEEPILEEHGCTFFEWGAEEQNRFYNFMIDCLQEYLKNGLAVYQEDLSDQYCKENIDPDLFAWLSSQHFYVNQECSIKTMHPMFLLALEFTSERFPQWQFTSNFKEYLEAKGYVISTRNSNGDTKILIKEQKNEDF